MLIIFGKLRNSLRSSGTKFHRYLLYASGEIILVVIGILLALQVNNWNQDRKDAKKLSQYYLALAESLGSDTVNLSIVISILKYQDSATAFLLPILESKEKLIPDSLKFISAFIELSQSPIMTFDSEVWDEMKRSGLESTGSLSNLGKRIDYYYKTLHARDYNFSNVPQEARFEHRRIKYELLSQEDLIRTEARPISVLPSRESFQAILDDVRQVSLARFINRSSVRNVGHFENLKNEAGNIITEINKQFGKELKQ